MSYREALKRVGKYIKQNFLLIVLSFVVGAVINLALNAYFTSRSTEVTVNPQTIFDTCDVRVAQWLENFDRDEVYMEFCSYVYGEPICLLNETDIPKMQDYVQSKLLACYVEELQAQAQPAK